MQKLDWITRSEKITEKGDKKKRRRKNQRLWVQILEWITRSQKRIMLKPEAVTDNCADTGLDHKIKDNCGDTIQYSNKINIPIQRTVLLYGQTDLKKRV